MFGLDPGPRLDALRDRLSQLLAYGDRPITLLPPPPPWMERLLERRGPIAGFFSLREEVDELLFEQVDERRRRAGLTVTTFSPCCSTPVTRTARRCPGRSCGTS